MLIPISDKKTVNAQPYPTLICLRSGVNYSNMITISGSVKQIHYGYCVLEIQGACDVTVVSASLVAVS